jgi:hypothetical protein
VTTDRPHDPESADDAAWRSIVDNYGDRPEIPDDEPPLDPLPPEEPEPVDEPELDRVDEGHFVPPPPPPLPRPAPPRLIAWMGLFGVPAFVLVMLVVRIDLPTWVGLLLMAWFVGGFVYLVASMRPGAGDDYDDGARL